MSSKNLRVQLTAIPWDFIELMEFCHKVLNELENTEQRAEEMTASRDNMVSKRDELSSRVFAKQAECLSLKNDNDKLKYQLCKKIRLPKAVGAKSSWQKGPFLFHSEVLEAIEKAGFRFKDSP